MATELKGIEMATFLVGPVKDMVDDKEPPVFQISWTEGIVVVPRGSWTKHPMCGIEALLPERLTWAMGDLSALTLPVCSWCPACGMVHEDGECGVLQ